MIKNKGLRSGRIKREDIAMKNEKKMCIRDRDSTFGTSDDVHTVEELKAFFSSALYDQNLEDAIMDCLLYTSPFWL